MTHGSKLPGSREEKILRIDDVDRPELGKHDGELESTEHLRFDRQIGGAHPALGDAGDPSQCARRPPGSEAEAVVSGTMTISVGTPPGGSAHAGQAPYVGGLESTMSGSFEEGIAKIPGRVGSPIPTNAAFPAGVATTSVGCAPMGRKLITRNGLVDVEHRLRRDVHDAPTLRAPSASPAQ